MQPARADAARADSWGDNTSEGLISAIERPCLRAAGWWPQREMGAGEYAAAMVVMHVVRVTLLMADRPPGGAAVARGAERPRKRTAEQLR
jgi:hypothetical protein